MEKWNNSHIYVPVMGKALEVVPNILAKYGLIATIPQAMDRKIEVAKSGDENLINTLFGLDGFDNGFFTLTPIFYHKNGNIKIGDINDQKVRDYIFSINLLHKFKLYDGLSTLPNDFKLNDIQGTEFTRKDILEYANKQMPERQAKRNIFWRALADNNQERLDEFVECTYKVASDTFKYMNELMMVQLPDPRYAVNTFSSMGLFWLGGVHPGNAQVDGSRSLNLPGSITMRMYSTDDLVSRLTEKKK